MPLPSLVARALSHINALLPGPPTTITVEFLRERELMGQGGTLTMLIGQTGTAGSTGLTSGRVSVGFGTTQRVSIRQALRVWLPRMLAHEIDHSVRILGGPGFGQTLLEQMVSEGVATAFDEAAFPGPPDPWVTSLTHRQECVLWRQAQPVLTDVGLYDQWMFGGFGVPHWTAFAIGYQIVEDYHRLHPYATWDELTRAGADSVLTGSHYTPCVH